MQCAFAIEQLTQSVWDEIVPLLRAHWREVAHFKDIPLEPDESFYATAQANGITRFFTARRVDTGQLVGYAMFFVKSNPHYASSIQAVNDVVFLDESMRGMAGWKLLRYCDAQLVAEGVDAIYWHIKAFKDFGAILERMGCELVDQIYARRVERGSDRSDGHRLRGVDGLPESGSAEGEGRAGQAAEGAAGDAGSVLVGRA